MQLPFRQRAAESISCSSTAPVGAVDPTGPGGFDGTGGGGGGGFGGGRDGAGEGEGDGEELLGLEEVFNARLPFSPSPASRRARPLSRAALCGAESSSGGAPGR